MGVILELFVVALLCLSPPMLVLWWVLFRAVRLVFFLILWPLQMLLALLAPRR